MRQSHLSFIYSYKKVLTLAVSTIERKSRDSRIVRTEQLHVYRHLESGLLTIRRNVPEAAFFNSVSNCFSCTSFFSDDTSSRTPALPPFLFPWNVQPFLISASKQTDMYISYTAIQCSNCLKCRWSGSPCSYFSWLGCLEVSGFRWGSHGEGLRRRSEGLTQVPQ